MRKEVPLLRQNVHDFLHNEILKPDIPQPVLEIGPADERFAACPEYFVDTRKWFSGHGVEYRSCDVYPESGCDIIDDVLNLEKHVELGSIGSIIALEVLEHTSKIWLLPKMFYNMLKPGGKIFISVPYYFYRHSPFPDYWRISEDGLRLLFSEIDGGGYFV
jgi:hypothetical protein